MKTVPAVHEDVPVEPCEECGCEKAHRTPDPQKTSFALNGSGWFHTGGY
jgi:hypothetical protein